MMKELSLTEIQKYSLDVLLHVHEFCQSHDIQYSLAYGTLIGAVRHKGFIPWDDDVDIIMTRENFDKFLKEYHSDSHYMLVSPEDKKSYIAFARVCDIAETRIVTQIPWSEYTTGIWIDIFPMDSVLDDEDKHKSRYEFLSKEWYHILRYRHWMGPCVWSKGLVYNLKMLVKKLLLLDGFVLRREVEKFIDKIQDPSLLTSYHCAQLACCDEYGFFEKADFSHYTTIDFEGHQLCVIKEYDKMLRAIYGDYMQLPPEDDRKPRQQHYIRFFEK